ncbi:MAG: IS5 family transposase, partial [Candidatus Brockarchaeota archaeon]|nr:IS5 family transposase [Candidatus Brockarchaeota archaeon]
SGELNAMNSGKVGRPYMLTIRYVEFLSVVRYIFSMPYRQLEGFTRALNRLIPKLPSPDYSGLRRRILRSGLSPYEGLKRSDEPIAIAVDSTGVRVHKAGGWVERTHGMKKRYIKVHFAVNVETKEVVAMEVTTDDTHDLKVFPRLLEEAESRVRVLKVYGDGAYDGSEAYRLLESKGIEAIIKPRENSISDTPSEARRKAVEGYRRLGYKGWAKLKGYGKRWSVETAYSAFKRAFGESCMAKTLNNITKELITKAFIYNTLINL